MTGVMAAPPELPVDGMSVAAYEIPTDRPESDGTLEWASTTVVVVELRAAGRCGVGYTYGPAAIASLVHGELAEIVHGADVLAPEATWAAMQRAVRNAGQTGPIAYAISAVDVALHDLKARVLEISLADMLGRWHDGVEAYGSGGFTSYGFDELREQAEGWLAMGAERVKIKVGRDPSADPDRLAAIRDVIGAGVGLMVDANGAYTPARALAAAHDVYDAYDVIWLEEPVSSDDRVGLRRVRDGVPPGMQVAAGEYGMRAFDFEALIEAEAVDVLQPDVTRCGGVTGVGRADALAGARCLPISAHCAPAISAHVFAACETAVHIEYFHDHARIERMLFDGALVPVDGALRPDLDRPGLGIELKTADAERFAA